MVNLHINHYNFPFYLDHERDEYILPQELAFCFKLNNRHLTLKLLSTMKILSILEENIECISVRDAIDTLKVPNLIALDIANEHDCQIDLYSNIVIEPNITYTYPNQYWISLMSVKYVLHRFTSFILTYVYVILHMYVIVSTFLLLYHTVSENVYSRKVYACKSNWFIHNYCTENIFLLKMMHMCSYMSFVCNIHIWDIQDVDHIWSLFNTELSYILSILL